MTRLAEPDVARALARIIGNVPCLGKQAVAVFAFYLGTFSGRTLGAASLNTEMLRQGM